MELMQLEMLVAAVEEGGIQAAAERVFRTQPAVSIALRKLEEEIGAAIFDRTNRRNYDLTESGRILYDHAKRMLALRDETIRAVNELQHLQRGHLRLGALEGLAAVLLPPLLAAFSLRQPDAPVEVFHQSEPRLLAGLRLRHLDFAILALRPEGDVFDAARLAAPDDGAAWLVSLAHSRYSPVALTFRALLAEGNDG